VIAGYPLVVLAGPAGLAINLAAHVSMALMTNGRWAPFAILSAAAAGLTGTIVLSAVGLSQMRPEPADGIALAALNLAIYLALAFGYFNFVNLNMTALRPRILLELLEVQAGLTRADLLRRYNAEELVNRRIARLTLRGHLVERHGRLHYRGVGLLLLARGMTALKWIVLGHGNLTLQAAIARELADRTTTKIGSRGQDGGDGSNSGVA
jgi:hypothetical protein